jgi:hypothetical protein
MSSRKGDRFDLTAPCCTRPATDPWEETLPNGRRVVHYPPGPTGGEMRSFRDQDTGEIHYIECTRRGVDGSQNGNETAGTLPDAVRPFPTASYFDPVHVGAYLGKRRSTIYAWGPFLESADKIGSNLIFWTESLVNDDIPELENRLPSRAAIKRERFARRASGEVLRRGRHSVGCLKDHLGPCGRSPRPDNPRRRSQQWRRDLGKNRKK